MNSRQDSSRLTQQQGIKASSIKASKASGIRNLGAPQLQGVSLYHPDWSVYTSHVCSCDYVRPLQPAGITSGLGLVTKTKTEMERWMDDEDNNDGEWCCFDQSAIGINWLSPLHHPSHHPSRGLLSLIHTTRTHKRPKTQKLQTPAAPAP